jgi:hypothetical protein
MRLAGYPINCDLSNGSHTELSFLFMSGRKKGGRIAKKMRFFARKRKMSKIILAK